MAAKTGSKSANTKKKSKNTETARWNGHKFIVSSSLICGFGGLQISGSSDTEQKQKNGQIYIARKNGNPAEISFTAYLNAFTGCDVRKEALAFVDEAQKGKNDYLYVGKKKLVTYKLLLTDATINEIEIAHNNTWVSAEVQISLKQTGTGGKTVESGSGGSGSGGTYSSTGSKKQSVKNSSTVTDQAVKAAKATVKTLGTAAKNAATTVAAAVLSKQVKNANAAIKQKVNAAKKYTKQKKVTSGGVNAKPNLSARL